MKLGYLTPLSVATIANAHQLGYDAIEVGAGWIGHSALDELEANRSALADALAQHQVAISSVAIYGGAVEVPVEDAVAYYTRAIKLARALGCGVVSGLTGRDNQRTVTDNLPLFSERFGPIAKVAEDEGVRIAFEPWPGSVLGHGPYRWTNMATTPELWEMLFDAVPSRALGLEYDPSHLVWQGIDHLLAIREFGDRIYHMHAKDIVIDEAKLKRGGVHGARGWWRFVMPGLGQIDWAALFATLKQVGYAGDVAVEHEDNAYMGDKWNEGLTIAYNTLRPLVAAY